MGWMLSTKLYKSTSYMLRYWCPGCEMIHPVYLEKPPYNEKQATWSWNQDAENPTFHPSIVVTLGEGKVCHAWIRDGNIVFLGDSFHALKGLTVPLPDIPKDEQ